MANDKGLFHTFEGMEDWLADNGYVQYGDARYNDLEQRLTDAEELNRKLFQRLGEQHMAITFILQGRVNGFKISGTNVELVINSEPSHAPLKAVK